MPVPSDNDALLLLGPAEAAARLGIDKRTLDFFRSRGHGPRFIRLSEHTIRYDVRDLDAFIEARRIDPTAAVQDGDSIGNR